MTEEELSAQVDARWGDEVFVRQAFGEGVHPEKRILECGKIIAATARNRAQPKTITFDASCIPEDALDKIAQVIA